MPVNGGVLSLVSTSSIVTIGAVISADTMPVPGNDSLPAGSVAVAVTVSPSTKPPGFGTLHSPVVGSATTSVVLPSGKVTVTVEPGSAVPVIGSVALIASSTGASGAVVSTVNVDVAVDEFPAASVAVTVTVYAPSVNAGSVLSTNVHVPSPLLVAG